MNRIAVILFFIMPFCAIAQTATYSGVYEMTYDLKGGGKIARTLSLDSDGSFTFHLFRQLDATQPEENKYAKGNWKVEKEHVIYFFADQFNDIDGTHTLNFNNTKARYISKSKRNKSERIIKKSLNFYDSEIFWVKSMKLVKKD